MFNVIDKNHSGKKIKLGFRTVNENQTEEVMIEKIIKSRDIQNLFKIDYDYLRNNVKSIEERFNNLYLDAQEQDFETKMKNLDDSFLKSENEDILDKPNKESIKNKLNKLDIITMTIYKKR